MFCFLHFHICSWFYEGPFFHSANNIYLVPSVCQIPQIQRHESAEKGLAAQNLKQMRDNYKTALRVSWQVML